MPPEPRVLSLLPGATETVCALGRRDRLVGRSHECDYPAAVRRLPVCAQARLGFEGRSYGIDERIRAVLREGLSIHLVDVERVRARAPDVIPVVPSGFAIARTLAEWPVLGRKRSWRALRALREGLAFVADGNHYFDRPGPRLARSLEILAEILHPERFPPRHAQRGWVAASLPRGEAPVPASRGGRGA